MFKNGYLHKEDIIGSEKYFDATGNMSEGIVINLREIEIEGYKLHNIKASIVKTLNAPLLLGQSALNKLGLIKLDLEKNQLTINSDLQSSRLPRKFDLSAVNLNVLKNAFILLINSLNAASFKVSELQRYYALNISDELNKDSLWSIPSDTYKELNSTSYYYTFINKNEITNVSDTTIYNSLFLKILNRLKSFSSEKVINWSLFDAESVMIKPYNDYELIYSFKCDKKEYAYLTTINQNFSDRNIKTNLPVNIDSKTFFEYRKKIYNEFMSQLEDIKSAEDQNSELSFFYQGLINYHEPEYNNLPLSDKEFFSSIYLEPAYWCERAANLSGTFGAEDEETLLKKMRLFSKGVNLNETNKYPFSKKSYNYVFLYSYRGECKYKMEDYEGAYRDYKKAIDIYEKNVGARDVLKTSITGIYYDFANICYFLKKYDECKISIQKGINSYSKELDKYLINHTLNKLYTLKGYIEYFIYKNRKQSCLDWSRAGELGNKDAYDYIKTYCNK
jgi:hypothetical protein